MKNFEDFFGNLQFNELFDVEKAPRAFMWEAISNDEDRNVLRIQ